jgi:hypothetical protein
VLLREAVPPHIVRNRNPIRHPGRDHARGLAHREQFFKIVAGPGCEQAEADRRRSLRHLAHRFRRAAAIGRFVDRPDQRDVLLRHRPLSISSAGVSERQPFNESFPVFERLALPPLEVPVPT